MRKNPFIKHKPTYCYRCNDENSLVYYNINGKPMPFVSNYTVANVMGGLRVPLSHMRCIHCGRIYLIDYSAQYPRAVDSEFIRNEMFV